MSMTPLYEIEDEMREFIIKAQFELNLDVEHVIKEPGGGFGDVYRLERAENSSPRFLAAKCPKIENYASNEKAAKALENMLREAEKTYRLFECPWVNPITNILLIQGWPFLISRWRHGTLSDLIDDSHKWSSVDRIASLLQIACVLRMLSKCGVGAHQDLKPDNIFFDDLYKGFPSLVGSSGFRFKIFVGDFSLADAFLEHRHNYGTPPFMAPEQFETKPPEPAAGAAIDIFAVGVIAHLFFCDGFYPNDKVTSGASTRKTGFSKSWSEDRTSLLNWAKQGHKNLSLLKQNCPTVLFPVISAALAADSKERPSPEAFEAALWEALKKTDAAAYDTIKVQVKELKSMYDGNQWPHFEDRLASLRKFHESL